MQNAVQLSIEQLSGSSVNMNAHPSDPYRFPPRTAQELKESAHLVPGASAADLPPPDDGPEPPRVEPRLPPPKAQGGGWLL